MNAKLTKIKLTERDKRVIEKNQCICTDSHGKDCVTIYLHEKDKSLN